MAFITGKHLARRTFLRGMGATVALPFLDAMVPAGRVLREGAGGPSAPGWSASKRCTAWPGCNDWGASKYLFAPEMVGRDFELVPDNPLSTLEAYRDYLTIVSNTDVRMAEAFTAPEIGGDHFRSSAVFLTQSHPKQTQGSDIWRRHVDRPDLRAALRAGHAAAVDAVLHREPRPGGRLHLQLLVRLHRLDQLGLAERAAADDPRPARRVRHAVRRRRHGRGPRRAAAQNRRSILDWITGEVADRASGARLERPRAPRPYLDNVREIERRIQIIEAQQQQR